MAEYNPINRNEFLEEKIKRRPVNKGRIFRRLIEVLVLAVLFGGVACVTMVMVAPILEETLFPTPSAETNKVIFAEESATHISEEVKPEDMLLEETMVPEDSEIWKSVEQQMVEFAALLHQKADSCKSWLVKVSGVFSQTSWLSSTRTRANVAMGAVVADNGREFLILVEQKGMTTADSIRVTLPDDTDAPAFIKGKDDNSGLMIIAVPKDNLKESTVNAVTIASLSSSNNKALLGDVVLAVGSPNGVLGSANYGILTAMGMEVNNWDVNYKHMMTDIYGSTNQEGFLLNLRGEIIGIVCNDYNTSDVKNLVSAIGISELKGIIQLMSNGEDIPSLGIMGTDVTRQANLEHGIPYGAYVTNVKINEPAMKAGIQAGDVIMSMNDKDILSMSVFSNYLLQAKPGETIKLVIKRQSQGAYKESELEIVVGKK